MHKKMLLISQRLNHLKSKSNGAKLKRAKDHLWASQCNCPYWHGIFGGAYLNHLRYAIYHEMLQAEKSADELDHSPAARKKGWVHFSELDFDLDGYSEILVSTKSLNAYFAPANGGTLFELDFKPKAMNLMDSMSRREEAYHQKLANLKHQQHSDDGIASIHDMVLAKEEGLEKKLFYDWYRHGSLIDHFLEPGTTIEQFASAQYREKGDFVNQPYQAKMEPPPPRVNRNQRKRPGERQPQRLTLWRQGKVWVNGSRLPVEARKTISFEPVKSRLQIAYIVSNLSSQAVDLWFGSEFLFALLAGNTDDRYYTFSGQKPAHPQLGSIGAVENAQDVGLTEEWLKIKINLHTAIPATIWRFPIETISQSEAGFEKVYQSSIVLPNWHLQLEGGASWQNHLTLQLSQIKTR
jgi:alpha-amylase